MASTTRAALRTPYAWGAHDCAIFAADCVRAMTGEDLAAEFRGRYADEAGARDVLSALGCEGVADLAGRFLPEIPTIEARRGDVVMIDGEHGPFLAIVDGRTAVGPALRGLSHTPVSLARRAWRVG